MLFKLTIPVLAILAGLACYAGESDEVELEIPELQRVDLPNGMPLYHVHLPKKETFLLRAVVWGGHAEDPKGRGSLGHVLEHLLFFQPDQPIDDFEKEITSRGGDFNGSTSRSRWHYYVTLPMEDLGLGADWLHRVLWHDELSMEYLEETKTIIRVECGWPDSVAWERFNLAMEGIFFYSDLEEGTWERIFGIRSGHHESGATLRTVRAEEVERQYREYYVPENMVLVYAGPHSAEDVLKALQPFGQIPGGPKPEVKTIKATKEGEDYIVYGPATPNSWLRIGHSFLADDGPPFLYLGFYRHILESLLQDELRNRRGQTYSVDGDLTRFGDARMLTFGFSCDRKAFDENLALARDVVYDDLPASLTEEDYSAYRAEYVRSIFHEPDLWDMSNIVTADLYRSPSHDASLDLFTARAAFGQLDYDSFLKEAAALRELPYRYESLGNISIKHGLLMLASVMLGFLVPLILVFWYRRRYRANEPDLETSASFFWKLCYVAGQLFLALYLVDILASLVQDTPNFASLEAFLVFTLGLGICWGLLLGLFFLLGGSFLPSRLLVDEHGLVLHTMGWRNISIPREAIEKVEERRYTLRDFFRFGYLMSLRIRILEVHRGTKRPLRIMGRRTAKVAEFLRPVEPEAPEREEASSPEGSSDPCPIG